MLLTYGDCSKLKNREWCMLEVRSEKTIEPTLRRIGKAIPAIFREDAVEIFIPVGRRDLDIFDLEAAAYLFVRSANFQGLLRLKTITGVVSLVTVGDSNRPSEVIKVPDADVQPLIQAAEKRFRGHSSGIGIGSFVRVLNGETRDFCGNVVSIGNGKAVLRITLKTKSIMLETPLNNLLNLTHVPPELRAYYHCPLVSKLKEDEEEEGEAALPEIHAKIDEDTNKELEGPLTPEEFSDIGGAGIVAKLRATRRAAEIKEALRLVREDTKLGESPLVPTLKKDRHEPIKKSRQKTVTALVRKLILIDGIHTPLAITAKVLEGIKKGDVKKPKNCFIIYTIVKDNVMQHWARKNHPELASYRDVVRRYGEPFKFSARQIAEMDPTLSLPLDSNKE
jgi:hypothetical protein